MILVVDTSVQFEPTCPAIRQLPGRCFGNLAQRERIFEFIRNVFVLLGGFGKCIIGRLAFAAAFR